MPASGLAILGLVTLSAMTRNIVVFARIPPLCAAHTAYVGLCLSVTANVILRECTSMHARTQVSCRGRSIGFPSSCSSPRRAPCSHCHHSHAKYTRDHCEWTRGVPTPIGWSHGQVAALFWYEASLASLHTVRVTTSPRSRHVGNGNRQQRIVRARTAQFASPSEQI
jgi:hypothetical protein